MGIFPDGKDKSQQKKIANKVIATRDWALKNYYKRVISAVCNKLMTVCKSYKYSSDIRYSNDFYLILD